MTAATAAAKRHGLPDVDQYIRYEAGEMGFAEQVEFFQALIDSGVVWELQGSYGRMAFGLIAAGWCHERNSVGGGQGEQAAL